MKVESVQVMTELLQHIESGNVDAVKRLVHKKKLDLKTINQASLSPLIFVCPLIMEKEYPTQMLKYLISTGLNVHETKQDISIFDVAIQFGSLQIVHLLITQYKFSLNRKNSNLQNPLHLAIKANEIPLIEYLIKNRVNINQGDITKMTPLHYAVISMSLSLVKILVENGADCNIKNQDQNTPLDLAVKLNLTSITKYLKKEPQSQKMKYSLVQNAKKVIKSNLDKKPQLQQQLLSSIKNINKVPSSWQQKQLKVLSQFLQNRYAYLYYQEISKIFLKLRSNYFSDAKKFREEIKRILKQLEATFGNQEQIMNTLKTMRQKIA